MSGLAHKIVEIHRSLDTAGLPHAFGGALALAWCTQRPRGTSDIDLNVFVDTTQIDRLLAALPEPITATDDQREILTRDGQARLFWDTTPLDLFLDTTEYHRAVLLRAHSQTFAGHEIPFLGCSDLAVFKAFFDRTKDWADIEEMVAASSLDAGRVLGELALHLGGADPRVERLRALVVPAE